MRGSAEPRPGPERAGMEMGPVGFPGAAKGDVEGDARWACCCWARPPSWWSPWTGLQRGDVRPPWVAVLCSLCRMYCAEKRGGTHLPDCPGVGRGRWVREGERAIYNVALFCEEGVACLGKVISSMYEQPNWLSSSPKGSWVRLVRLVRIPD